MKRGGGRGGGAVEKGEKKLKRLRRGRKGKRKKGGRGRTKERETFVGTSIGRWKRNDLERGSSRRTGTRDPTSSPFSPFTYTPPPGNGIANPTTLHASWQLVISRPVPRQHTPSYVSPSSLPLSLSATLTAPLHPLFSRPVPYTRSAQITRTRINSINFRGREWRRKGGSTLDRATFLRDTRRSLASGTLAS